MLVYAIEQRLDGCCCRAADTWTQDILITDVMHAAAVSNAIKLCVPAPGASINSFLRLQFGKDLLCDTKLVKHALQLLDRNLLSPHIEALEGNTALSWIRALLLQTGSWYLEICFIRSNCPGMCNLLVCVCTCIHALDRAAGRKLASPRSYMCARPGAMHSR